MLVKIHGNMRVYEPQDLTRNLEPKKPFIGLRGPGRTTVNIYGGTEGLSGLQRFLKELLKAAPKEGTAWIALEGVRENSNQNGFIGFVTDLEICSADPEDIEWARSLDRAHMRAQVEGQAAGLATQAKQAAAPARRPMPATVAKQLDNVVAAASSEEMTF